ncbi:MAG: hypothetical protein JO340_16140 [Acidobacteriaceae bacterium]|nr:hypothetical protein [Acidobacteriaceae bacterium]
MFIDEWFGEKYYKQLALGYHNEANFSFGQIFWTHAYYPHENLELWRPVLDAGEPTKTIASQFRITTAGQDAFKRNLPLHAPRLETNEEFLVIRAKIRPVILIQTELPLAGISNRGYRGRVQRRRTLVGQVFGLADATTREPQFDPKFVERVRRMEFPQLMFLPEKAGVFTVDSMLRLDEAQSVFVPHLEAKQFSLGDDAANILRHQLSFLQSGIGPNDYTELREFLMNE